MKTLLFKAAAVSVLMSTSLHCLADEEMLDVETKWRARIAKEKIKQSARDRAEKSQGDGTDPKRQCGSQSIGNVDTGGRPGSGPREVFVFAPNAINIVGPGGCR